MVSLNLLTLNVRGVNSPVKRLEMPGVFQTNLDIAFVQESHFKSVDSRVQDKLYKVETFSSTLNKMKVVSILVSRTLNLSLRTSGWIVKKDSVFDRAKVCLASIYAPKNFYIHFVDTNLLCWTLLDTILIFGREFVYQPGYCFVQVLYVLCYFLGIFAFIGQLVPERPTGNKRIEK